MQIRKMLAVWLVVAGVCVAPDFAHARAGEVPCNHVPAVDVTALLRNWKEKLETYNARAIFKEYAPNASLLPTKDSGPYQGDKILGYFEKFVLDRPQATFTDGPISTKDCRTVYAAGLYTFELNAEGNATVRQTVKARYTFIFEYDGKKWLILHHHSSKVP